MRQESLRLREDVLKVFARYPSRDFSPGDVVDASGASPSCVYKNLKALVASGEIVKDSPGVYRWPTIEDAKTTPDLISPAPAPSTSGERPTDEAPAPTPHSAPVLAVGTQPLDGCTVDREAMLQTRPFAGIDYELIVIGEVVRRIESLTGHETRVRVAAYVAARFLP